jgi:hypothetical protein
MPRARRLGGAMRSTFLGLAGAAVGLVKAVF